MFYRHKTLRAFSSGNLWGAGEAWHTASGNREMNKPSVSGVGDEPFGSYNPGSIMFYDSLKVEEEEGVCIQVCTIFSIPESLNITPF